jgi:hypothetical protein
VLAYDVRVSGTRADGMPSREHVILDAQHLACWIASTTSRRRHVTTGLSLYSGVVPLHSDLRNDGMYALRDATRGRPRGLRPREQERPVHDMPGHAGTRRDNQWGDGEHSKTAQSDAVDAAYGQNMTWDFYKAVFGRNGIADDGRGGFSRVHSKTGTLWYNAFWSDDCFCMTYTSGINAGSRACIGLDVAGHEMTHGVTSNSAGLIYSDESGG